MEQMGLIIRDATAVINCAAWKMFAQQCEIPYPGTFCSDLIRVFVPDKVAAKRLFREKRERLAIACKDWGQSLVEIFWSMNTRPLPIPAGSPNNDIQTGVNFTTMSQPLIALPSVEIGALTLTRQLLDRIVWMIEHPEVKTGIVACHNEAQLVMSKSSATLLTTTTLSQAVQRKRAEYWHPHDLLQSRIRIGEYVRDLRNGTTTPDKTRHEVSWRGVSTNGSWRRFTNVYETFIDDTGIAYQFSISEGFDAIDAPSDLILT